MRTQQLAHQVGVNPQTLRYYERIGLLPEPPRTSGGYRDYPDYAVRLLRFIGRAKELGFQLDEVQELLEYGDHADARCGPIRQLAVQRVADLERRIADLVRMHDALAGLANRCVDDSHECAILDALDEPEIRS